MMKVGVRDNLILLLIGFYLVLNYGFMLVRVPPMTGWGVPFAEIFLLVYGIFLVRDCRWLPSFSNNIVIFPFLMWWGLGIFHMLYDLPTYGMWAFRDGTHVIESLFVWVGFVYARTPEAIDRLFTWLRVIVSVGCLYAFTYPFGDIVRSISPHVTNANGVATPILGYYTTSTILMLWESTRRFIAREAGTILIPALLIAYSVALFQARTTYLQIIALAGMMLWFYRKAFAKLTLALVSGVLVIAAVSVSGIKIEGRLGEAMTLDFLVRHIEAIGGVESQGLSGAAAGVDQRLGWWDGVYNKATENAENLLLGRGYGFPLISFRVTNDVPVREPHNSLLSIFARAGVLGLIAFACIHVLLFKSWLGAFKLCRQAGYQIGCERLLLFLTYFILIAVYSLGEDAYEKPYNTVPYYFLWGVVLHYRIHLIRALAQPVSAPVPSYGPKPAIVHENPNPS